MFITHLYRKEEDKRDRFSAALYATEKKNSTQTTLPHFNFSVTAELNDVTSRLIILINEEINKANCMVRNSAKLDRRTKQHTQFGISTSDSSRDMARTKSWRKKRRRKKKKKFERMQNHIASPTGIANNTQQWYHQNVQTVFAHRMQKGINKDNTRVHGKE